MRYLFCRALLVGGFTLFGNLGFSNEAKAFGLSRAEHPHVQCLAENIYHEARGESITGMVAVTAVAINRSISTGRDVCSIIYERASGICQFSWTCRHPRHRTPADQNAWRRALMIATIMHQHAGQHPDPTHGAMFFSNCSVARGGTRIGDHCFRRGSGFAAVTPAAHFAGIRQWQLVDISDVEGALSPVGRSNIAPLSAPVQIAGSSHRNTSKHNGVERAVETPQSPHVFVESGPATQASQPGSTTSAALQLRTENREAGPLIPGIQMAVVSGDISVPILDDVEILEYRRYATPIDLSALNRPAFPSNLNSLNY